MTIRYKMSEPEYDIAATFQMTDGELPLAEFVATHRSRTDTDRSPEDVRALVVEMADGKADFDVDDDGIVHSPIEREFAALRGSDDDRDGEGDDGDDTDEPVQQLSLSL